MLDESNLITIAEGPTMVEIEARLREQAEKEIERQKEIFVRKLAEQKARLDELQKLLEQVLAGFRAQPTSLPAPTAIQASVKPPTAYYIIKLAAPPASMQVTQPVVSKSMPIVQGLQRDHSIDGSILDVHTAQENISPEIHPGVGASTRDIHHICRVGNSPEYSSYLTQDNRVKGLKKMKI
uniref:Uncharacterized protein n=1 Tax=Romanomermis culicivorax TaxID=13658 RepID=A0A915JA50_ROMCU